MENPEEIASLDPRLIESYPKVCKAFASMPDHFCYALAERHPRLMDNIESVWGTRQCIDFLDGLMLADRPDRQGFSLPVMSDLMMLKEVHETLFPALSFNANDPFSTMVFDAAATVDRDKGQGKAGGASERRSFYRLGASTPPPITAFGRPNPAGEATKSEETGEKKKLSRSRSLMPPKGCRAGRCSTRSASSSRSSRNGGRAKQRRRAIGASCSKSSNRPAGWRKSSSPLRSTPI